MSNQLPAFRIGGRYRVRDDFNSAGESFSRNEILVFRRRSYSSYDSSFCFEFSRKADGAEKTWWVHEDPPYDRKLAHFIPDDFWTRLLG